MKHLACSAGRLSSYIRIFVNVTTVLIFAPGLAGGLGIDHRCDRVRLPRRTHQEKNFIRVNSRDSRPTSLEVVPSPQAAIALPLDRGHFVGGDIYLERAIFADASLFAFKRNPVMAWRERHAKPSIIVRRIRMQRNSPRSAQQTSHWRAVSRSARLS